MRLSTEATRELLRLHLDSAAKLAAHLCLPPSPGSSIADCIEDALWQLRQSEFPVRPETLCVDSCVAPF